VAIVNLLFVGSQERFVLIQLANYCVNKFQIACGSNGGHKSVLFMNWPMANGKSEVAATAVAKGHSHTFLYFMGNFESQRGTESRKRSQEEITRPGRRKKTEKYGRKG